MDGLTKILERMQREPLGTLVAELRELHERGGGVAPEVPPYDTVPARAPAADARPARATTEAHATTVRGAAEPLAAPAAEPHALQPLGALLRRAVAASAGAPPLAPPRSVPFAPPRAASPSRHEEDDGNARAAAAPEDRYALLRRHFGEQETQLRRQAQLSDRILSQLEHGEVASALPRATPLQQEVRILCPAGGRSGARALLRNELRRPVLLELRAHPPRGADPTFAGLRVACDPRTLELAPEEERLVRIGVDLGGTAPAAAGELELVVDVRVDDAIVQKIWVALLVLRSPTAPAPEAEG